MKLGYEVIISDHDWLNNYNGQGRVVIDVREMPNEERYVPDRALCLLTWTIGFGDAGVRDHPGQFEVRIVENCIFDMNIAIKAARRILKPVEAKGDISPYKTTPAHILDAFDKIKAVEMAYDLRFSSRVPIETMLPSSYKLWYASMPNGNTMFSTVQEMEIQAQSDIIFQAASRGFTAWTKEFCEAGMPVKISQSRDAPDPTPARERLAVAGLLTRGYHDES